MNSSEYIYWKFEKAFDDDLCERILDLARNKFKKALRQWQIYRSIEKLNFFSSAYCFIHYAFRAVFRK